MMHRRRKRPSGISPALKRFTLGLAMAYAIVFGVCAIAPSDRAVWLLENVLTAALVILLVVTWRPFPFSGVSYSMFFAFLCLHTIGAYYTYAHVPYDDWFGAIAGCKLNELMEWERNHFDRLVHFTYGLFLAYPVREIFLRIADAKGLWGYLLPLVMTMATSMMYELIEWTAVLVFGDDHVGMTYLGTQGDVWDAHKDMALASLGAAIAMAVTALWNLRVQRDFAREWNESLRIKRSEPLGEVAIQENIESNT